MDVSQIAPCYVAEDEAVAGDDAAAALRRFGLLLRPDDRWEAGEQELILQALADFLRVARWTTGDFRRAMGGPITLLRDRQNPTITDAAGVLYPVLGLYDEESRTLTINNWIDDKRTGGAVVGRRVVIHELAHAWDGRSRYWLSRWLGWLPGARASDYAHRSRFEDWADAVMGAVYGANPGYEAFDRDRRGAPSPRLRYVRAAFARYRRGAAD